MRDSCKIFVEQVAKNFSLPEPIFEFGSLQVANQEEYANLRPIFDGKKYVGIDMRRGLGVDLVGDIMNMTVKTESVGTIIAVETLEHVKNPFRAVDEIYRVLKSDGIVIITTPMYFKIHAYPYDYWRMTPSAYEVLLSRFENKFIFSQGEKKRPHTVFALACKRGVDSWDSSIEVFKEGLDKLTDGAHESLYKILKRAFRWGRKQKDVNL